MSSTSRLVERDAGSLDWTYFSSETARVEVADLEVAQADGVSDLDCRPIVGKTAALTNGLEWVLRIARSSKSAYSRGW